ncbi:MAG: HAMP domain-containing histidine kinase [Eubacterium sp.]|nr:HAMP domain-containing histidine kinase [Eubacterium sp.]
MDGKSNRKIRAYAGGYLLFFLVFSMFMFLLAGCGQARNRQRLLALAANDPQLTAELFSIWEDTKTRPFGQEPIPDAVKKRIRRIEAQYGYSIDELAAEPVLWIFWGAGLSAGFLFFSVLAFVSLRMDRKGQDLEKKQQELYECLEQYRNGIFAYVPDYTQDGGEWMKISESLRELGVYFLSLKEQLKEEENSTKALITDISHQLKTPLASLKMSYELAAGNWLDEKEKKEFFLQGEKEVEKLELLLGELVNLSRLEAHMIQITPVIADFQKTLSCAVSQNFWKAKNKQIAIQMWMDQEIRIPHDAKWTQEALANVIDNAIKYSGQHTTVTVRVIPLASNLLVEIEDEGIGIRPQEQQKIYQRFYRGTQAGQMVKEGAGVGLYLARMILERQGGTICAKRKEGRGTIFQITLPLQ